MSNSVRVLYIDLSERTSKLKVHSELGEYFGGVGISTALLYRYFEDFGFPDRRKQTPFVLATGPFCGLFPGCSQTVASFVSPQTGNLGQGVAGGDLGLRLKEQGVDALFVQGKADKPLLLVLSSGEVEFRETGLWGKGTGEAFAELDAQYPHGAKAVIGPAGENRVRFSSVLVDRMFSYSRMGLGSVWGQKKLKGVIALSGGNIEVPKYPDYSAVKDKIYSALADPRPEGLRFGIRDQSRKTWVLQAQEGGLPSKNFSVVDKGFLGLQRTLFSSSEETDSCGLCPVGCKNVINLGGKMFLGNYEELISLGPMLGLDDPQDLRLLREEALELGVDPVSLGVSLAFFVEKEGWEFGHIDALESLLQGLVAREEDWAKKLSFGVLRAASGKENDYAMAVSGLELLPYFNGYFTVLSQIVSPETDIRCSGAHLLDLGDISVDEKGVQKFIAEEKRGLLCLSLASCPWLRGVYNLSQVFECSQSLHLGWSHEGLEALSSKIYNLKWKLKRGLGFDWENQQIPRRLFGVPTATGYLEEENLLNLVTIYQQQLED